MGHPQRCQNRSSALSELILKDQTTLPSALNSRRGRKAGLRSIGPAGCGSRGSTFPKPRISSTTHDQGPTSGLATNRSAPKQPSNTEGWSLGWADRITSEHRANLSVCGKGGKSRAARNIFVSSSRRRKRLSGRRSLRRAAREGVRRDHGADSQSFEHGGKGPFCKRQACGELPENRASSQTT